MNRTDVEVAVVGAGPVGSVLALALARAGVSVALVEARPAAAWNPLETDLRVYALSRASENILRRLDAWERIAAARAAAYRAMEVWDAGSRGRVRFTATDVDEPDLGHIVEGNLLAAMLVERVRTTPDIEFLCPAALERMVVGDDAVTLGLDGGRTLSALLVVGADGAGSRVRTLAGIEIAEAAYEQTAIVAHLAPEKPHADTARQVFRKSGPLALLPLADGRISIVWSAETGEAKRLEALADAEFAQAVTEASENVLGSLMLTTRRAGFTLRRLHAESYVAPRVALAGDAAHVVHPLAGQGMNLGLLDATALAEVIADGRHAGHDADDYLVLRRYERWRHGENLAAQSALGGFKQLFGMDFLPVRALRGAGMRLFDRAMPAKRLAIRIALGTAGDLPELAKPLV